MPQVHRLTADGLKRFLSHADDVGCLDDLEPAPIEVGVARELGLDGLRLADELHAKAGRQLAQRERHTLDFGAGSLIAPHRVERDADHAQLSSTSSRFFPA